MVAAVVWKEDVLGCCLFKALLVTDKDKIREEGRINRGMEGLRGWSLGYYL
jgi:hypothetical protein